MKDLRGQARVTAFLRKSLAEGAQDVLKLETMARREALLGERQRITDAKAFKRAKYSLRIRSVRAGFGPNGSNSRLPMVTVIRPSRARCVGTRACSLQSKEGRMLVKRPNKVLETCARDRLHIDADGTQQFALWAAGKTQSDSSNGHRKSCKGGRMAQVDPWEKAADCERAIRITLDPLHRETLTKFLSDDALATQIETIGRLHAKIDRDARP